MKSKEKKTRWKWFAPFFGMIILVLGVLMWSKMEGQAPEIRLTPEIDFLGLRSEVTVSVSDPKSGLSKVWIGMVKGEKESILAEESFLSPGIFSSGGVREKSLPIVIEPKKLGVSNGKIVLRILARDNSWRHWFHGNPGYLEKELTVDIQTPQVIVMSKFHYLNQGGTGLVVYKLSESCPQSGVWVGKYFFPGYGGHFDDPLLHVAFFALNFEQGSETPIAIQATDPAGNATRAGFPIHIKAKRFKKDVISLSDSFLNQILPRFDADVEDAANKSPIDRFIQINRDLRQKNYRQLIDVTKNPEKNLMWNGAFMRLPNSENRAGFADSRDYVYQGKKVDEQVHLGVDLAALAHAPVPAANRGKVVFADNLGIYGQTLVIDHGFGVFSMYSHLSDYVVQTSQVVEKGEIIGHTGDTGLAGGDHLHFSMIIHDTFVHPVEWWDPLWIDKRVVAKLRGTEND